ncbi:MAG: Holliday junction branch migration protein RuvA [Rikenellaceae bacterium]
MFDYIRGSVAELNPTYAVIEAAGVGYHIITSLHTYSAIENREEAKLYIHFVVREDAQILYGFSDKVERELFRLLISVSGVGGNTARMILSTYSPKEIQSIILTENATLLKNVKGLGLKSAQKIIVELTGKITSITIQGEDVSITPKGDDYSQEACEALVMLGFSKAVAQKALKGVYSDTTPSSVEEAIRMALKRL